MPVGHQDSCSICLGNFYDEFQQYGEDFNNQILAEVTPCGHCYHLACVQAWFNAPGNHLCPNCQGQMFGWNDITQITYSDYYDAAYGNFLNK